MKKSIILFAFLFIAGMVSAQTAESSKKSCSKTCAKTCTKAKGESSVNAGEANISVAAALTAADVAAEADESIERRVCDMSGAVGYYKKHTCDVSGKVSFDEVFYDEDSKTFVASATAGSQIDNQINKGKEQICKPGCTKTCCLPKEGKGKKMCAPGCVKDCCKKA